MCEIKTFDYDGQKLRAAMVENSLWWSLHDVSAIIKIPKTYHAFAQKLSSKEKKIIILENANRHGGSRMIFISPAKVYTFLNRSYRPEAVKLQRWIEEKFPDIFNSETEAEFKAETKSSIQASLQKAQMLIRIAEHKAVPLDEQLRLLDLAVKELTGVGLNLDEVTSLKAAVEKTTGVDIMDLPEVVGFIKEKTTKTVDGVTVNYLTADMMAKKWREPSDIAFSCKDFSEFADEYGYKSPKFGFWQRVMTPDGEAREFMYIEGTMLDYMSKKVGRVA